MKNIFDTTTLDPATMTPREKVLAKAVNLRSDLAEAEGRRRESAAYWYRRHLRSCSITEHEIDAFEAGLEPRQ